MFTSNRPIWHGKSTWNITESPVLTSDLFLGKFFSYLLLHNNITTNWVAWNNMYLLLHSFCGSGVSPQCEWVFCFTSLPSRHWLGCGLISRLDWGRIHFQAQTVVGWIQVHVGCWTEGLSFLGAFSHKPPMFLAVWASTAQLLASSKLAREHSLPRWMLQYYVTQ